MKRYSIMILVSLLALSIIVSGCGSKGASNTGANDNDKGKPAEISIASWNLQADALDEAAEKFNASQSEVKVNVRRVSNSYDSIVPALTAGIGAPDIVAVQMRDFANFMGKFPDQFVDLSDELMPRKDEFSDAGWGASTKDGKIYAIPVDIAPTAVYYRKDYFEEAGINPDNLTTWDKFMRAGKKLQSKLDGVKMTTFSLTSNETYDFWQMIANQLGGRFYDEQGKIDFTNEANIKAMKLVKELKEKDLVVDSPSWNDRVRAVVNGETATIVYPIWWAGTVKTQAADQAGKWGIMPLPAFTEGGPNQANLGGSVFAVTTQSEHPEAAWKFLKYLLLTEEGQKIQMDYGLFPAWKPFYKSESFATVDKYFGFSLAKRFGELATDIPAMKFGQYFYDVSRPLETAFGQILNGNKDIKEAFKDAEKAASKASGLPVSK